MEKYLLLAKSLVFLWFVGFVVVNSEIEKRDVHRIVLKGRRPRSHHSRGHHRGHGHKHSHQHDFDDSYESHGKRAHREKYHDHSSEDSNNYYGSHESSYEEFPKNKGHYSYRKPTKARPYFSSAEYEDLKSRPRTAKWTPSLSSESIFQPPPEFDDHGTTRKLRKENNRYSPQLHVDMTTKYPPKSPYVPFYSSDFSDFSFTQKTVDLKQSPLIRDSKSFVRPHKYKIKNNSYEVHEKNEDDQSSTKEEDSFKILSPFLEFTKPDLAAAASNIKEIVGEKESVYKEKKTVRGRRNRFNSKN